MENNNLPKISKERSKVFNTVKRYIDKLSTKSNNKQIIDNFTYIKQYDVLSMPAFRMITNEIISESPNGTIIMADINDLFVANKFRGKEQVNIMLGNMINTIKNTLNESECVNYKIGKMGDEIYIYTPDKNEQEASEIVNKINNIKENELTISAGLSSNLSKGLINAINEADKNMTINKSKFKSERLKSICGNNLEKIINNVIENQLDKMRINLDQLKNNNKSDLRNTFDKAVEDLDIEEIILNMDKPKKLDLSDEEDTFEKLKKKYNDEATLIYGNNPKLINEYVLASMISKHPVENVVNSEFFQALEYKKVYKRIKKDKNINNFNILAMDLSGLKVINDTLGHEEGDKAIADALEYIKTTLKENKIKTYSDIIAKSAGDSYVLIEEINDDSKDNILTNIHKYGTSEDSKYNMSIICSTQSIDKKDLNKSNFINIINSNLIKVEDDLQKQSFDKKLKNVDEIKNSIKKIYQQIINMDDIQLLLRENLNQNVNILDMIKTEFKNCIEKERDTSHLNKSKNIINLEKESKINKTQSLKKLQPYIDAKSI